MNSDLITELKPSKSAPLLGFWYPAGTSRELRPGTMQPAVRLGLPLLLCRDREGRPAALRDICPHRAMPLSFGRFDGSCVECAYHGWRFDLGGRCREIPSLVNGSAIEPSKTSKISVATYPCQDRDGYLWVFIPDPQQDGRPVPEIPRLPLPSRPYRMLQISTLLDCTIDDGIVGLMDPAHGPFVHQSSWWRTPSSAHEKSKTFEPIPNGFRMVAHAPSKNSGPYKLVNLFGGGTLTTTIDFVLPNQRFEFVQCGSLFVSTRATVTPITDQQCRIDFCAAWNCFRWVPFTRTLFRFFARTFLNQDKRAMERQAQGLRYKPAMMLLDDADTPAKWYYKLKAAYVTSIQTGQPLEHPLKGPVTLRWRS
jgi:phenylpropionate dioxygenase-like ring-hydroxylating dioxygenase large terminal subunit